MSQSEKAALYKELQAAGVQFSKHYREYKTAELQAAVDKLREAQPAPEPNPEPDDYAWDDVPTTAEAQAAATEARAQAAPQFDPAATAAAYARMAQEQQVTVPQEMLENSQPDVQSQVNEQLRRSVQAQQPTAPVAPRDPNEMPGVRQNQPGGLQPIRTDEYGRVWYQEEVLKPASPQPRGRRVLKYMDSGVREETVKDGKYVETFEVAGDLPARATEAKITLPSYQVGIYKDRRFPFKVHTYNGREGFDLFEVQDYYNGAELVPSEIKRVYVENVLCYDIRTTVRAIQTEYRNLQLQGKVK